MTAQVTLFVTRMGTIAAECLGHGPLTARVRAAFARSAYLEIGGGLVCAGGAGLGDGPINLLLQGWPGGLAPGHCVFIDARAATIWTPPPWPKRPAFSSHRLAAARETAARFVPASGLCGLVLGSLAGQADPARAEERAALPGLQALAAGDLRTAALHLGGLGSGLTPAGDDLLIGAMLARHALARKVDARCVLEMAATRTHAISLAHLEAAARGMASSPLHDAIGAILADGADLEAMFANVAAIGHSSGMDALAGILLELAREAERPAAASPQTQRQAIHAPVPEP